MLAHERAVVVMLRMAMACVVLALVGGALSVLHYLPTMSPGLQESGLGLARLRPIHTAFASTWIYGAAIAVMYHWLHHQGGGLDRGDLRRFWFHNLCWIGAGVAILVTLAMGVTTGREYVGFHPAIAAVLLLGWFAFAWNFLKRIRKSFWAQPVYVYQWTVGVLFFVYTFVEWHAYLLPGVGDNPVRDLQLQWKSCGTLVGSFNFLVYGCLLYANERITGDKSYGQSAIGFSLFGVGCLNSFTNFAHHTYHLPGDHTVKWIAFVVSMAEALILFHLLGGILKTMAKRMKATAWDTTTGYFTSARWWTAWMLVGGILISVPTLNSYIHGTHAVVAHAMGTELGIDSMVLFGAITFLLHEIYQGCPDAKRRICNGGVRYQTWFLNGAMVVLVGWLTISGVATGVTRFEGQPTPLWVTEWSWLFPVAGFAVALGILLVLWRWIPLLLGIQGRREAAGVPAPSVADPA